MLGSMRSTPGLFKTLTNFFVEEFDELCHIICPTITAHAYSIGEIRVLTGSPSKLTPEQRLLSFLLYIKHDPNTSLPSFFWNQAKSLVIDDQIFIASSINWALRDKIRWPNVLERQALASMIPTFPSCIGIIDGTLVKIRRPLKNPKHGKWFNGRKKIYCMNNVIIVDHHGLFIYVDPSYRGSFHDVTCLRASNMYGTWREYFIYDDANQYFEYVLGDLGYVGIEMFIMRQIQGQEMDANIKQSVVDAWNKMHAGYRIQVEWGIGGLKQKWQRLMKQFDSTRPRFDLFFEAAAKLTNFLDHCCMNFDHILSKEQEQSNDEFGWDGDF